MDQQINAALVLRRRYWRLISNNVFFCLFSITGTFSLHHYDSYYYTSQQSHTVLFMVVAGKSHARVHTYDSRPFCRMEKNKKVSLYDILVEVSRYENVRLIIGGFHMHITTNSASSCPTKSYHRSKNGYNERVPSSLRNTLEDSTLLYTLLFSLDPYTRDVANSEDISCLWFLLNYCSADLIRYMERILGLHGAHFLAVKGQKKMFVFASSTYIFLLALSDPEKSTLQLAITSIDILFLFLFLQPRRHHKVEKQRGQDATADG
eukprot:scaffold13907_cov64-Cylindrotheca_fusiformis.AAC.1